MTFDNLAITEEVREMQETARRFALEVMRPAGIALDALPAERVAARDSLLFEVARRASELGLSRMTGPQEIGGVGASPLEQFLVLEELAWGNAGLAGVIFLNQFPAEAALASGNAELIDEIARPYFGGGNGLMIGAWAITEPDHGSDTLSVVRPEMRVRGPGQIVGRRDGDHWILTGQKSAWVSNGPIATHVVVNVHLDPNGTLDRGGVFVLSLDRTGISRGKPLEKHGLRSLPQGEIYFDEVRVPRHALIAEGDAYPLHVQLTLTAFNAGVGCLAAGLARAAYETALRYTKERLQGGRPIFEHQAVRSRLFRMFSLVQACRSLSQNVYVHNLTRLAAGEPAPLEQSIASKVFCTDAALEVATLAAQLHGGNGMTKEYPVEMFLRDAMACTIADGENAFLAQLAAAML